MHRQMQCSQELVEQSIHYSCYRVEMFDHHKTTHQVCHGSRYLLLIQRHCSDYVL